MLAIVGGYVVQRVIEGAFMRLYGMHIHVWEKVDSDFRLITARRNPNMVILLASVIAGRPDLGLIAVAVWTILSLLFHGVRLAQAVARKAAGAAGNLLADGAGMMNATIEKFGFPATLVQEYAHWVVLLRPAQPTLGSLVLAAKSEATAFGDLPAEAFAELAQVIAAIEGVLAPAVRYQKINYLMLMLVDPHVHFHVIPRYEGERSACGVSVTDASWGKPPALGDAYAPSEAERAALVGWLKDAWPA